MSGRDHRRRGRICAVAALLAALAVAAPAREYRNLVPIASPQAAPPGFRIAQPLRPLDPRVAERAVRELMAAWNTAALDTRLSERFVDRSRLLDAIAANVPRDARVRVLSVHSVQTLRQYRRPVPGAGEEVMSTVTAIVRSQIEFNDPGRGFQRLEGSGEYVFDVRQRIDRR